MEFSLPYAGEIPRAILCSSNSQLGSTAEKEYGEGQVEIDKIREIDFFFDPEENLGFQLIQHM